MASTIPPERQGDSKSHALFQRACALLVGGVSSPVRAFAAVGGRPRFVERAKGCYVYDVDGRAYVDLVGSWGPAILGHAHPTVVEAVCKAAERGLSFGACCPAEADLAAIIVEAIPSIELLRFVNSGTEATMSALRLARAFTNRDKVLKFAGCYHGHVDSLLVAAGSGAATFGVPSSPGVPKSLAESTLLLPYNDLPAVQGAIDRFGDQVAAILVEPIAGNMGYVAPVPGFLQGLRDICDRHGTLLVFDEVMTGFRVGWGGYQNLCGIRPDLTCLGKVIGGGLPVAAYGGRKELMSLISPLGPVYQAGTLSGNPLGMAAGLATLTLCRTSGFYDELGRKAHRLAGGFQHAAGEAGIPLQVGACGGIFGIALTAQPIRNFDDARASDHRRFARFFQAMLDRSVWLPPSGYEAMFVSAAHDDTAIDTVLQAATASFKELAT